MLEHTCCSHVRDDRHWCSGQVEMACGSGVRCRLDLDAPPAGGHHHNLPVRVSSSTRPRLIRASTPSRADAATPLIQPGSPEPRRGLGVCRLCRLFNVLFRLEMIQLFQTIMFGHRHITLTCLSWPVAGLTAGVTDLPSTMYGNLRSVHEKDPEQLANVLVVVVTGDDES